MTSVVLIPGLLESAIFQLSSCNRPRRSKLADFKSDKIQGVNRLKFGKTSVLFCLKDLYSEKSKQLTFAVDGRYAVALARSFATNKINV